MIFTALGLYLASGLGITGGAHRLWAHRSYKARLPLRILLTIFNTIAFQDCVIHWARDHRVHHKYSETDADPHNATRYVCVQQYLCKFTLENFLSDKIHFEYTKKEKTKQTNNFAIFIFYFLFFIK